jgi:hypothetical protein
MMAVQGFLARPAFAQSALLPFEVDIHGFVSGGGLVTTSNDYIGDSSRGSVELFESGINFSTQATERLHMGLQVFTRDVGALRDAPGLDWAFLDYRWRPYLGLRCGVIKMPFGLYNEYVDIDSARVPVLLPQGVYPLRNRDVLLSHTGVSLYGEQRLGGAGSLEYQAGWGRSRFPRTRSA